MRPTFSTLSYSTVINFTRGQSFPIPDSYRPNQAIGYARGGQAKVVIWNTTTPKVYSIVIDNETKAITTSLFNFFDSIQWLGNSFYYLEDGNISQITGTNGSVGVATPDEFNSAGANFQTNGVTTESILHITSGPSSGYHGIDTVNSETRLTLSTAISPGTGQPYEVLDWSDKIEVRLINPEIDWSETKLDGSGSPLYTININAREEV